MPPPLPRHRSKFCRLYLIIEHAPVLMVYGFEDTLYADAIAVTQFGVTPCKDVNGAAAAGVFQFECCVVVASARGGFPHDLGRPLQRDGLVVELAGLPTSEQTPTSAALAIATDFLSSGVSSSMLPPFVTHLLK